MNLPNQMPMMPGGPGLQATNGGMPPADPAMMPEMSQMQMGMM